MRTSFMFLLIVFLSNGSNIFAQEQKNEAKILIQTSAQCEQCKKRIEETMAFEPGVKNSVLDLKTKQVTVVYNPKKTSPDKIRAALSKVGYDADNVPADQKAYKKLPACCKKPGDPDAAPHGK
jgi:periplasmic mercuric ion binding protein